MSESHAIEGIMGVTMEKIREMVDVDTIIGKPILTPDGTTIIPVSKVSFGFVSGGSDLPSQAEKFAGGSGAGVTVKPQAFIVISKDGDAKMLEMGQPQSSPLEGVIEAVPDVITKIKALFAKDEDDDKSDKSEKLSKK